MPEQDLRSEVRIAVARADHDALITLLRADRPENSSSGSVMDSSLPVSPALNLAQADRVHNNGYSESIRGGGQL